MIYSLLFSVLQPWHLTFSSTIMLGSIQIWYYAAGLVRKASRDIVEPVGHVRHFWLRWPLHLAVTPALNRRSDRCGRQLDWFVPVRPYSADLIQWSTIGEVRCSIWGSTEFSAWATVVYSVHSGCSACRRQARSEVSHCISTQTSVKSSSPVVGTPAAVDQLSTCLADVEASLKASRLRLNPGKISYRSSCGWVLNSCFPDST